jgi:superfamily I DNA/RNA helicase
MRAVLSSAGRSGCEGFELLNVKGRSAQYVFLIGVHSGELPSNARDVRDIEICRFLVGLTRTKRKCSILVTRNAMGTFKRRSEFIAWINRNRFGDKIVDAAYWENNARPTSA